MGCRRGLRQAAVETEAKQPGLQPPDNRGEQQKKQQQAAEEGRLAVGGLGLGLGLGVSRRGAPCGSTVEHK